MRQLSLYLTDLSHFLAHILKKRLATLANTRGEHCWFQMCVNETLKASLERDVAGFFDERANYERFGVSWKRGIIMHGLPGNGKTLSVKALRRGLATRPNPVPTLYSTLYLLRFCFLLRIFSLGRKFYFGLENMTDDSKILHKGNADTKPLQSNLRLVNMVLRTP